MFIVLESQKNGDILTTLVTSHQEINEAKSKYHTVLAAAAISNVELHAASLLDDCGRCLVSEYFTHEPEVEE